MPTRPHRPALNDVVTVADIVPEGTPGRLIEGTIVWTHGPRYKVKTVDGLTRYFRADQMTLVRKAPPAERAPRSR